MHTQKTNKFDVKNKQYVPQTLKSEVWKSPLFKLFEIKNGISVFLIKLNQFDQKEIDFHKAYLSKQEQHKATRYRFVADQNRYILGHAALRFLTAKHLHIHPAKVLIEKDKNNKPFIANENNTLSFNLSHSENNILLVFDTEHKLLGVDVERIDEQYEFNSVIKDYFTNEEQRFILKKNSRERFFQIWTRKEALMKALGTGLTDEIKTINVLTDFVKVKSTILKINTFQLHNNYIMSLALENHNAIFSFWNTKNIFKNIR